MASFTLVVKKALQDISESDILDKPENLCNDASAETITGIWQHLIGVGIELYWTAVPSLLDIHSTLCIQCQSFPATPRDPWGFTCIRSGCLSHDSDYYHALAESYKKNYVPADVAIIADTIWRLLVALDLPMQPVLSHFFDERFSERCAAILSATLEGHFRQRVVPWLENPLLSILLCVAATRLLSTKQCC